MKAFKGHAKKKIIAAGCAALTVAVIGTVASANRQQTDFDPSKYAASDQMSDSGIEFDSTVFGSNQNKSDGLEMDKNEEDYNLTEGDTSIRDEEQSGEGSGSDLSIADGSEGQGGTNVPGSVVNDGSGSTIVGDGGSGGATTPGEETKPGGDAGGGDSGDGPTTPGGDGGGSNPGQPGGSTPGGSPSAPETDSDDNKYGVDYDTSEKVDSEFPSEDEDKNQDGETKQAESLSVTGSLMVHFYPGERPQPSEMFKYISVSATMEDGTQRNGLQYCRDAAYGGDYTVAWDAKAEGSGASVGTTPGSSYTATIQYRGMTATVSYDIVTWQVTLKDFEEPNVDGFVAVDQTAAAQGTPIVDLSGAMQNMYNVIDTRTNSGDANYLHVNRQTTHTDGYGNTLDYYVEYFGGWSAEGGSSAGNYYKMQRPTDSQVKNGVYNVDLKPTWVNAEDGSSEYFVVLRQTTDIDTWDTLWQTELLAYSGDSPVLRIPDGVSVFDMETFSSNIWMFNKNVFEIEEIVIPESLSTFGPGGSFGSYCEYGNLKNVYVDVNNQNYLDIDGVLYDKLGQTLLYCPDGKTEITKWSKNVVEIASFAFMFNSMEELDVPAAVTTFENYAFYGAYLDRLTLETTEQMSWGKFLFAGTVDELTVKELNINSPQLPLLSEGTENSCFWVNDPMSYMMELEIAVTVPDGAYLNYLALYQKYLDSNYGIDGAAFAALRTASGMEEDYIRDFDGFVFDAEGTTLVLVPAPQQPFFPYDPVIDSIVIPEGCTAVGELAFVNGEDYKTLTVPSTVTSIASGAFSGLTNLKTLVFRSETPPEMGENVFGETDITGLHVYIGAMEDYGEALRKAGITAENGAIIHENSTNVDVDGDESGLYADNGDGTFTLVTWKDTETNTAVVKQGTTVIGPDAFKDCDNLTGVILPNSVTEIGSGAFAGCAPDFIAINATEAPKLQEEAFGSFDPTAMIGAFYVPAGSETSYEEEGYWDTADILAPARDYEVITTEWTNCTALYGKVDDSETDSHLALVKYMSMGFMDFGTFTVDSSATEICAGAFSGCSDISALNTAADTIGAGAFEYCWYLTQVDIYSIPTCGAGAFESAPLEDVYLGQSLEDNGVLTADKLSPFSSAVTLTLRGSFDEIKTGAFADWSSLTSFIAEEHIGTLGENLFADCAALETINLGNTGKIGAGCFKGTALSDITLGTISTCGEGAFEGCNIKKLTVIATADTEENFDVTALSGFNSAEELTLSGQFGNVTGSFSGWANLKSFTSDYEIGKLGAGLFKDCKALRTLSFSNLVAVGAGCFDGCTYLEVSLETAPVCDDEMFSSTPIQRLTVRTKGSAFEFDADTLSAFSNTLNLTISGNCSKITGSFSTWQGLQTLTVEGAVQTLGEKLFAGCTGLKTVSLTKAVNIGANCFNGCTALSDLTLLHTEDIGDGAFKGCTGLTCVSLLDTFDAANNAFENCPIDTVKLVDGGTGSYWPTFDAANLAPLNGASRVVVNLRINNLVGSFAEWKNLVSFESYGDNVSLGLVTNSVFAGCTKLGTVTINNVDEGETVFYAGAFIGCPENIVVTVNGVVQTVVTTQTAPEPAPSGTPQTSGTEGVQEITDGAGGVGDALPPEDAAGTPPETSPEEENT